MGKYIIAATLFLTLLISPSITFAEKVIVEVEDSETINHIKNRFSSIKIRKEFETVFTGFSAEVEERDIEALTNIDGVTHVYESKTYQVSLSKSVPFIGGEKVRSLLGGDYGHLTGKGVKVGIIDTGIDYDHPDIKNNYHGGYDVVDSDDDPMETQASEGAPTLHGTHVSGIIGANGKVKGVAPEVELYGYRTLGPGGVGTSEQVIEAIEKAVEDGMDVINLSLGNSVNGPDWPTSIAINKAVEQGVVAVTSNGNSGPAPWTVGSPGTATKAISVAASSPPMELPFIKTSSNGPSFSISPMQGSVPIEEHFLNYEEVALGGLGNPNELEEVKGKIALVERGVIPFTEKAVQAERAGAKAVLIYNNEEGPFNGSLQIKVSIPVYSMSKKAGEYLLKEIKNGNPWIQLDKKEIKDTIAPFSSRGPVTHTWEIKPDISAPGVAIKSTIPGGYLSLQGTSMAAPHIAGAAALVLQAHPDWNPTQVKAALMKTAKLLKKEDGKAYKPFEQGAGRVQVDKAVQTTSFLYPQSLPFGQFHNEDGRVERTLTITFENIGTKPKHYRFDMPSFQKGVQWQLPMSFKVQPNESKEVKITLDINPFTSKKGIYQDFLTVHEDGSPIYIPYLYVVEEPNYPRIMGFSFIPNEDKQGIYDMEFYLPEKASEVGVALFDEETLAFKGMLFHDVDVERGHLEKEIKAKDLPFKDGSYRAIIFADVEGQEDQYEQTLIIGEPPSKVELRK